MVNPDPSSLQLNSQSASRSHYFLETQNIRIITIIEIGALHIHWTDKSDFGFQ